MTNKEKLNGIFIEVLDQDHGQKVKAFFESAGIDINGFKFINNKKDNNIERYYGFCKGVISLCYHELVKELGYKVLTLEEAQALIAEPQPQPQPKMPKGVEIWPEPKLMEVWDNGGNRPRERVVFGKIGDKYLAYEAIGTLDFLESLPLKDLDVMTWENAKEIKPTEKLTKAQIASMLGRDINSFEITE